MFEQLSDRLNLTLKKLKGQARISEENIAAPLREIRIALLEAGRGFTGCARAD